MIKEITLLCCGSREWNNKEVIKNQIVRFRKIYIIKTLVHGNARGADRMSAEVFIELGFNPNQIKSFPADWTKFGKSAGPIRNREMLRFIIDNQPSYVIAFHNDIASSKGTKDMIKIVKDKKIIPFEIVTDKVTIITNIE